MGRFSVFAFLILFLKLTSVFSQGDKQPHLYPRFNPNVDSTFLGNPFTPFLYYKNGLDGKIDSVRSDYGMRFNDDFEFHGVFAEQRGFYFIDHYINMDFEGAYFAKRADFTNAEFNIYVSFADAVFDGYTSFIDAKFNKGMSFRSVNFNASTHFNGSFNNAQIINSKIQFISFSHSTFHNQFVFASNETNMTNFESCVFNDDALFSNNTFKIDLKFNNTKFRESPDFNFVNLPSRLELRNISFLSNKDQNLNSNLDFRQCKTDSIIKNYKQTKCAVYLEGADLTRILLPYSLFEIHFDTTTTFEMKCKIFEGVINTCKREGMILSTEGWDTDYQRMISIHNRGKYRGTLSNWFNTIWWNFGHDKWLILIKWLPLFFVIFFGWNLLRIEVLTKKMYYDSDLGSSFYDSISEKYFKDGKADFSNWNYRLTYTFFYTATIYFGFKLKHDAVNYTYMRGLLYLYLMYGVGALHVAFALSYILGIY
jgi:hypothetical protein